MMATIAYFDYPVYDGGTGSCPETIAHCAYDSYYGTVVLCVTNTNSPTAAGTSHYGDWAETAALLPIGAGVDDKPETALPEFVWYIEEAEEPTIRYWKLSPYLIPDKEFIFCKIQPRAPPCIAFCKEVW